MRFPKECLERYWIQEVDGLICIDNIAIFPEKNVQRVQERCYDFKIYTKAAVIVLGKMEKSMKIVMI